MQVDDWLSNHHEPFSLVNLFIAGYIYQKDMLPSLCVSVSLNEWRFPSRMCI